MVSIVLPSFNPPNNWASTIASNCKEISKVIDDSIELILVNDGSTKVFSAADLTFLKSEIPSFRYISYDQNMGKGYALRKGISEAKGDIVIYTDTDFPYTTSSFLSVYKELKSGTEIAIGVKDGSYYKDVPFLRKLISKILRKLIGIFLSIPITDTQCGLKGFRSPYKHLFLETTINRYLFDMEFVYKCYTHKPKLKVEPILLQLKPGIFFRKMNSRILITELRNFLSIIINRNKPL